MEGRLQRAEEKKGGGDVSAAGDALERRRSKSAHSI